MQASAGSGSTPQAGRSMPSMVTCSSLRRLLNVLLASSPRYAPPGFHPPGWRMAMSTREGLLERLLNWVVGALGTCARRADQQTTHRLLIPARQQAPDDGEPHDRPDYEREIELRVLMSTWM
jgi:hypothetical protein